MKISDATVKIPPAAKAPRFISTRADVSPFLPFTGIDRNGMAKFSST